MASMRRGRTLFAVLGVLLGACNEASEIPLEPDEDPLFSRVYLSRELMLPVPGDTLSTGDSIDYRVVAFWQRAPGDTVGAAGMEVLFQLWATNRNTLAPSDIRSRLVDSTLVVTGLSGVVEFAGRAGEAEPCEGFRFLLLDVRIRNVTDSGAVVLSRDDDLARLEEETAC